MHALLLVESVRCPLKTPAYGPTKRYRPARAEPQHGCGVDLVPSSIVYSLLTSYLFFNLRAKKNFMSALAIKSGM